MKLIYSISAAVCLLTALTSCTAAGTLTPSPEETQVTEAAASPAETVPETALPAETTTTEAEKSFLASPQDIGLYDVDGSGGTYSFSYNGESFTAYYWTDNWRIMDSYRITSESDIIIICQALADTHPVHNADYSGYRTAEDMAYEWTQHNKAYEVLPDGSSWKESARDVDLDPADQGKSIYDMFIGRIGG